MKSDNFVLSSSFFLLQALSIFSLFWCSTVLGWCFTNSGHPWNRSVWKLLAISPEEAFWMISLIIGRSQFSSSLLSEPALHQMWDPLQTWIFLLHILVSLFQILWNSSQPYFQHFYFFVNKYSLSSLFKFAWLLAWFMVVCYLAFWFYFRNAISSFIHLKIIKFFHV